MHDNPFEVRQPKMAPLPMNRAGDDVSSGSMRGSKRQHKRGHLHLWLDCSCKVFKERELCSDLKAVEH